MRLDDVTVELGGRAVVEAVSASVESGEAIAIVGRNAAGKTTLLRAMAGLLRPRRGRVMLGDRPMHSLSPRDRAASVAFVSQRPLVAAAFTVRELVALGRFARPRDDARVTAALDRLGLAASADRPYHELSVGQQQRASLARAMAQADARSLVLLDEPFAASDLGETARSVAVLREHAAAGGAVVAVLHDLSQACALASTVWILDEGRLVARGPTREVLDTDRLSRLFGIPFDAGPYGPVARLH
ncbi:MAG: ABC transporter ATP-binding protein [Phycisphaerales bacterium]